METMIVLTYSFAGETRTTIFYKNDLFVGRHGDIPDPDLDLVRDDAVSRKHARIWEDADGYWIEDCGSRRGTRVNGLLISGKQHLEPNDTIEIGKTILNVHLQPFSHADSPPKVMETLPFPLGVRVPLVVADSALNERLELLLDLPRQFGEHNNQNELLQLITTKATEVLPGSRSVLLLYDRQSDSLVLRAHHPCSERPVVSLSLARQAMLAKQGILWRREPGVRPSVSQEEHHIQVGMDVPLLWKGEAFGVLGVASSSGDAEFKDDDTRFLFVIAHYAALAVANQKQQDDLKETSRILELLLTNFSPKIRRILVEKARNRELHPGGKRSEITILFSDIRGFTALSRELEPEVVMDIINDYLSALVNVIFQFNGTIDKFIGDAILAVFGSPEHDSDQYGNAVKAAWAMQEAVRTLNSERSNRGKPTCQIGIGIHSGKAIHGFIGGPDRLEFTVVGDAVNIASRYCDAAQGGEILVSPELFGRVFGIVVAEKKTIPTKHEGGLVSFRISSVKNV